MISSACLLISGSFEKCAFLRIIFSCAVNACVLPDAGSTAAASFADFFGTLSMTLFVVFWARSTVDSVWST